ncbi:MAG: hypothetical protein K8T10_11315 [Candidatus Eremiobacteraeota bacterium]|nr:hypothetical protein [Candidatus Eremiobacteraeota bacterium]
MIERRLNNGFSLAEFIVSLGLFLILTSSLAGTLMIGMRCYQASDVDVDFQKSVRDTIEAISNDVRQAVPDDAPGLFGNPATGYKSITPSISPTGVLYPNVNEASTNYIIFNKPDYSYYNPTLASWVPLDPRNFRKIRYFVQNDNEIIREVTLFNSDGSVASTHQDSQAIVEEGSIQLICSMQYSDDMNPFYRVRVIVSEEEKTFSLSANCRIPGGDY